MRGDGLYVPVGTGYPSDDRVAEAGYMAELVSIRAALFVKERLTDGHITRTQLVRFAAPDIPDVEAHADRLVEVGLWERTDSGYEIVGWLDEHPSAEAVTATKRARSEAGKKSGHSRGRHGGTFEACPICHPQVQTTRSEQVVEPETETEPEPEPEPEPQPQPEPPRAPEREPGQEVVVVVERGWDSLMEQGLIDRALDIAYAASNGVRDATAWRAKVRGDLVALAGRWSSEHDVTGMPLEQVARRLAGGEWRDFTAGTGRMTMPGRGGIERAMATLRERREADARDDGGGGDAPAEVESLARPERDVIDVGEVAS